METSTEDTDTTTEVPLDDEWTLTSDDVCRLSGMTYRQLDYLTRAGIIQPQVMSSGPGTVRRWGHNQVRVLRMASVLRDHGATETTLRPAIQHAQEMSDEAWGARVVVTLDGRISTPLGADGNGWIVDLAHCRDSLEPWRVNFAA